MGSKTFWTRTNTILEQFYLRFQTYNFNMQICYGPVIDAILLSKWYRTFLDSLIPLRKIYIIYNETYFICCIKIKHLSKWVCGGGGGRSWSWSYGSCIHKNNVFALLILYFKGFFFRGFSLSGREYWEPFYNFAKVWSLFWNLYHIIRFMQTFLIRTDEVVYQLTFIVLYV